MNNGYINQCKYNDKNINNNTYAINDTNIFNGKIYKESDEESDDKIDFLFNNNLSKWYSNNNNYNEENINSINIVNIKNKCKNNTNCDFLLDTKSNKKIHSTIKINNKKGSTISIKNISNSIGIIKENVNTINYNKIKKIKKYYNSKQIKKI